MGKTAESTLSVMISFFLFFLFILQPKPNSDKRVIFITILGWDFFKTQFTKISE